MGLKSCAPPSDPCLLRPALPFVFAELIKRVERGGTMEMSQNQPGQS